MDNGKEILLFYVRLLAESSKSNGFIPNDIQVLAAMTNTNENFATYALQALMCLGLAESRGCRAVYLSEAANMIASESESAERVRKHREKLRQRAKALQCNARRYNVTQKDQVFLESEFDIDETIRMLEEREGCSQSEANRES
jgi:hypothetical protein